ncbi:uncharacterized protein EV154DRAFT_100315 [Mucor mucedo]|uniref:uncharacterized protein n=1 Tax=Mucor mucedo TaxID=29922 RepID=UPI00221EDB39|nr:uncharacterized protein EV154DRAFT_100315 [Mucor mucedo]KAI7873254.1 hypothetical protein EV154DRAFT_100315 [Mucor mucedo]
MAAPNSLDLQDVGFIFVREYYTFLHKKPYRLHAFYSDDSIFVRGDEGTDPVNVKGKEEIRKKIEACHFEDCKVLVTQVDSQGSADNGILVQVLGEMCNGNGPSQKFSQTFFLATQPNGYYILNDIFRFLKDEVEIDYYTCEDDTKHNTETLVIDMPTVNHQQVEEERRLEQLRLDQLKEEEERKQEALKKEEEERKKREEDELKKQEEALIKKQEHLRKEQEATAAAAAAAATAAKKLEEENARKEEEQAKKEELAKKEKEAKPSLDHNKKEEGVVEEKKKSSKADKGKKDQQRKEHKAAAAAAAAAAATNGTATPPTTTAPTAPTSWAALTAAAAAAPPPASPVTGTVTPTPAAPSPLPAVATVEAPVTPSTNTNNPDKAPQQQQQQQQQHQQHQKSQAQNGSKKETTHIFVKNVTDAITEEQLAEAFNKIGPVKSCNISRSRNCGFLEFEQLESAQKALAQNRVSVGSYIVLAEERRFNSGPRNNYGRPQQSYNDRRPNTNNNNNNNNNRRGGGGANGGPNNGPSRVNNNQPGKGRGAPTPK